MSYISNLKAASFALGSMSSVKCFPARCKSYIETSSLGNPPCDYSTGYLSSLRGGSYVVESEHLLINMLDDGGNSAAILSPMFNGDAIPAMKSTNGISSAFSLFDKKKKVRLVPILRLMSFSFYTALSFPWRVCKIDYEFYNMRGDLVVSEPKNGKDLLGLFLDSERHFGILVPCASGGCNFVVFDKSIGDMLGINTVHFAVNGATRMRHNTVYHCEILHNYQEALKTQKPSSHIVFGEPVITDIGAISDHVWLAFFVYGQFVYVSRTGTVSLVVFNPVGTGNMDFVHKNYYHVRPRLNLEVNSGDVVDDDGVSVEDDASSITLSYDKYLELCDYTNLGRHGKREDCTCVGVVPSDNLVPYDMVTCMSDTDDYNLQSFTAKFAQNIEDVELPANLLALGVPDACHAVLDAPFDPASSLEIKRALIYSHSL